MELEQIPGVGKSVAKRLRDAGFPNVETLAVTPAREVKEKAGYEKLEAAQRIVEAARELLGCRFITAYEHWEMTKKRLRCTTGSKALDALLGGGIETQAITELVGQYGSGKTQLCLMLCVTAQLKPEQGGLGGNVLYFDTEGTFSSNRVYQIAAENGLDPGQTLHNIILSRVYTSDHQMFLLDNAFEKCAEENVKLVVVDSVISHFRGEYLGRETLADRQQKLNLYMHKLLRLAEILNLAVVVTNQAQSDPTPQWGSHQATDRPAGGNILAHASTTRVWLRRAKGEGKRIARVFDSPCLPEGECIFRITAKGIEDAPEEKVEEAEKEE
ncbi:MAG: DNA repair and recombination protein RadA [Candidatus Jordarchaeales archaeon]